MSPRARQGLSAGLLIAEPEQSRSAPPARPQLAVAEAGPMVAVHTATALQQAINTAEAIFQSSQWEFELAGYERACHQPGHQRH